MDLSNVQGWENSFVTSGLINCDDAVLILHIAEKLYVKKLRAGTSMSESVLFHVVRIFISSD